MIAGQLLELVVTKAVDAAVADVSDNGVVALLGVQHQDRGRGRHLGVAVRDRVIVNAGIGLRERGVDQTEAIGEIRAPRDRLGDRGTDDLAGLGAAVAAAHPVRHAEDAVASVDEDMILVVGTDETALAHGGDVDENSLSRVFGKQHVRHLPMILKSASPSASSASSMAVPAYSTRRSRYHGTASEGAAGTGTSADRIRFGFSKSSRTRAADRGRSSASGSRSSLTRTASAGETSGRDSRTSGKERPPIALASEHIAPSPVFGRLPASIS